MFIFMYIHFFNYSTELVRSTVFCSTFISIGLMDFLVLINTSIDWQQIIFKDTETKVLIYEMCHYNSIFKLQ